MTMSDARLEASLREPNVGVLATVDATTGGPHAQTEHPLATRRRRVGLIASLVVAGVVALLAAACGGDDDSWSAQAIAPPQDAPLIPVLVNSQVGVGTTRIAFGLFSRDGALLSEATASVKLYTLDGDAGTLVSEHQLAPASIQLGALMHTHGDGSEHLHEGPAATVFVGMTELTRPEWWGVELSVELDGQQLEPTRIRFFVHERTLEPRIGDPAPRTTQLTLRDVDDVREVDSSLEPNPALHELTVAEALDSGRPTVVAFATPAFCQTRFCGPVVEQVVTPIWERHGDRVDVLHIEPFDLAEARAGRLVPVPAMLEWGLESEPWVFVIDADGRVAAKFEGIMSIDEVSAVLDRLLDGG